MRTNDELLAAAQTNNAVMAEHGGGVEGALFVFESFGVDPRDAIRMALAISDDRENEAALVLSGMLIGLRLAQ